MKCCVVLDNIGMVYEDFCVWDDGKCKGDTPDSSALQLNEKLEWEWERFISTMCSGS